MKEETLAPCVAIVPTWGKNYRKIAQENWNLSDSQMVGMHVHHRTPVSKGGTNDPSNLYVCSPSFHAFAWHGEDSFNPMVEWCSENGRKGGQKRAKQGYSVSDETKKKMSKTRKGRKHSKEHSAAISKAKKGKQPVWTPESYAIWIEGLRKPRGPQQKVTCPHCGLTGGISPLKRYHFDSCKHKNQ